MATKLLECEKGWLDPEELVPVDISNMREVAKFDKSYMTEDQIETRIRDSGADVYVNPILWPNEIWAYAFREIA